MPSLAWDPPHRCPSGLAVWEGGGGKPDLPGEPRAPASLCPHPTAPLQGLNQAAGTSSAQRAEACEEPVVTSVGSRQEVSLPGDAAPVPHGTKAMPLSEELCVMWGWGWQPLKHSTLGFYIMWGCPITEVLSAVYGVFALAT